LIKDARSDEATLAIVGEALPHAALERVGHGLRGLANTLLGECLVNVAHVGVGLEPRLEGRFNLLVHDHVPVDAREPGMFHDLQAVLSAAAQTFIGVGNKYLLQEVPALGSDVVRQFDLALSDALKELILVPAGQHEWRLPGQHLEDDAPHAPPVDRQPMALSVHDLWSQVLRRPAEGLSVSVGFNVLLRETEIRELSIPVLIYQYVLRLQTTLLVI
jgi:hypothetical protein